MQGMEANMPGTGISQFDPDFLKEVMERPGGEEIQECIQCGVCAGSCPVRFAMDLSPTQIIQAILLGERATVLSSHTIWLCASCYSCNTRCPRGIDLPFLMSNLKNMALSNGFLPSEKKIQAKVRFHRAFKDVAEKYGRVYEPELVFRFLAGGDLSTMLRYAVFGARMMQKGKISIIPSTIRFRKPIQSSGEDREREGG